MFASSRTKASEVFLVFIYREIGNEMATYFNHVFLSRRQPQTINISSRGLLGCDSV